MVNNSMMIARFMNLFSLFPSFSGPELLQPVPLFSNYITPDWECEPIIKMEKAGEIPAFSD